VRSWKTSCDSSSTSTWNWTSDRKVRLQAIVKDGLDSGMDVVDFIEHNLSRARTRKQIMRAMREAGMQVPGLRVNKQSVRDCISLEWDESFAVCPSRRTRMPRSRVNCWKSSVH
jgi:hypothetical protein